MRILCGTAIRRFDRYGYGRRPVWPTAGRSEPAGFDRGDGDGARQADHERGVARPADQVDPTIVRLDHRGHDGQAEAGAAGRPRAGGVAAGEPFEEPGCSVSGMPGPLSVTVTTARRRRRRRAGVTTVVPGGVCVRALASRLASTWCSRAASPGTVTGSSGRSSCQRWSRPAAWASLTASTTSAGQVDGLAVERAAGVEAGQQQQVVDQRGHAGRLRLDPAQRVGHVVGHACRPRRVSSA